MPTTSEAPKTGVTLETSKPWQPPNPVPTLVDQIYQVQCWLKNLLFSFNTKAPQRLVDRMNEEFFKIETTENLEQNIGLPPSDNSEAMLKSQDLQLKQLAM